jgi:pyruvate carboxylase
LAIKKILVANRSEIAIRVFRAANELGIKTVAIWAEEDKYSLHRFKADESYQVGRGPHLDRDLGPIESYLSIEEVLRVARISGADAIHPGYGLLSESPEFVEACEKAGVTFIGPKPETMRALGNKVAARNLAVRRRAGRAGDRAAARRHGDREEDGRRSRLSGDAEGVLGRRRARHARDPLRKGDRARGAGSQARGARGLRQGRSLSGKTGRERAPCRKPDPRRHAWQCRSSVRARLLDPAPQPEGRGARSGALSDAEQRAELAEYSLRIANATSYIGAGTVEYLMDADTGKFYFIEVNPRIQVEHTVTEEVTGIDIVKAQIHILDGFAIGTPESGVPAQEDIRLNGHALQCRITTEDPEQNFIPDYGRITAYRGATGFGIRLDGGTAYSGAVITRFYDPLLEKVTAWAPTPEEAIKRMDRALREFRIRGVATNLTFLEAIIGHEKFQATTPIRPSSSTRRRNCSSRSSGRTARPSC